MTRANPLVSPMARPDIAASHSARVQALRGHYEYMGIVAGNTAKHLRRAVIVDGVRYESAMAASAATGINDKTIREYCNGLRRPGWKWKAKWA